MSLHQLFCDNEAIARESASPFLLRIDPADRNHVRALRLQVGEHLAVVDASSDYFEVEIASIDKDALWVRITQHLDAPEPLVPITLVQGLAKGEKMDAVLRQATELGIDAFLPTTMKRSVVQLDQKRATKRHERSCAIARSAALQSGRVTIPEVAPLEPLAHIIETWTEDDAILLFWEEAPLDHTLRALFTTLRNDGSLATFQRFWIVIGPEGGIAPEEVAAIERSAASVFPLSLGPTILRTETAGVVACALALSELRYLTESASR